MSSAIADVVRAYGDIVFVADGAAGFVAAAGAALAADPRRIALGTAAAQAQSWDAVAARMWDDISALA